MKRSLTDAVAAALPAADERGLDLKDMHTRVDRDSPHGVAHALRALVMRGLATFTLGPPRTGAFPVRLYRRAVPVAQPRSIACPDV